MVNQDHSEGESRRRILQTLGAGAVASVAGCSGDGTTSESPATSEEPSGASPGDASNGEWPDLSGTSVHVVIDGTAQPVRDFWNRVIGEFKKATNADTRLEFVGKDQGGVQRVIQLLQAGDPPELFAMNQIDALGFIQEDALAPLTGVIEDKIEPRVGQISQNARVEMNGDLWLAPMFFALAGWYWRGDLAAEVGMDERPEWTWETTVEYAKKVGELDGSAGTYVPAGPGRHSVNHFLAWLKTNEGSLTDMNSDRVIVNFDEGTNRTRMVETLEQLRDLHAHSPVASDSNYGTVAHAIENETAASNWFQGYRPKMYAIQNERSFAADVHCAQMPKKRTQMSDGNIDGLGTFRGSNVDAARTLIDFTLQEKYLLDLYKVNPVHDAPPYPKIRDGEQYQAFLEGLPSEYTKNDTIAYQEEILQNFTPTGFGGDQVNPYMATVTGSSAIPNLIRRVLVEDENPDNIIDKHAKELQSTLDDAQGR